MKFFVVFLAIVVAVQADDWTPKTNNEIKAIQAQCIDENQMSKANIAQMKFDDNESDRKMLLCGIEKMGFFSTVEGFRTDRVIKQLKGVVPAAALKLMINVCVDKNEQNSPSDVYVYRVFKCFSSSKIGQIVMNYFITLMNLVNSAVNFLGKIL